MLFSSYEFIFLFLPFTFAVYFYLNKNRLVNLSKVFLVISSLFFYSWWNVLYLPLILLSIFFNYFISYLLYKDEMSSALKKKILIFGILGNLSALGFFKYADFLIENINFVFSSEISNLNLVLPLAISFFTFQQIAYLVDSYKWGGGGTRV